MIRLKKAVAFLLSIAIISSFCVFGLTTSASAEETATPLVTITDGELLLIEKLEAFGVIAND